jgi:catechol 2,3-dioxygenase-like lactoylglutathione lyase family enzyme
MLLGLRTAIYPVTDLEAARNWYTQLLGHPPYFDEPLYAGDVGGDIKVGTVCDPFGNRFGFIENPHFSVTKVR